MTLTNEMILEIKADEHDDWQPDKEERTFSMMLLGLEKMAEGMFAALFGADYTDWLKDTFPDSYINEYAVLDPVKEECRELIFSFIDGFDGKSNRSIALAIDNEPEAKEIYNQLQLTAEDAGMGFDDYVKELLTEFHSDNMEYIGSCIDILDDFLEDRGVRIPTSDEAMKEAGEDSEFNSARIYGDDYDELSDKFEHLLGLEDSEIAYCS